MAHGSLLWQVLGCAALAGCSGPRFGGTSGTSGTSGGACQGFDDEPGGVTVAIRLRNMSDAPVFVAPLGSCSDQRVSVTAQVGAEAGRWPPESCEPTCQRIMEGQCACPAGCAAPSLVRIEPGGVFATDWPGLLLLPMDLPAECLLDDSCQGGACVTERAAPDGAYVAAARFLREPAACDPVLGDPGLCDCAPNGEGWCVAQAPSEGDGQEISAVFQLPQETQVDVTYQLMPAGGGPGR